MSIESAIENAQQKVANAYTAVENKGGTLPETQNLSNLPTAINTISTAGTVETLNVTPTTSAQQFVPTGGVDGYNPVNVSAVTSSIDANITAGNIKNGVTILGTTGNYTGTTPTGTLNITQNGTYDVTDYASADVNVSGGGGTQYSYPELKGGNYYVLDDETVTPVYFDSCSFGGKSGTGALVEIQNSVALVYYDSNKNYPWNFSTAPTTSNAGVTNGHISAHVKHISLNGFPSSNYKLTIGSTLFNEDGNFRNYLTSVCISSMKNIGSLQRAFNGCSLLSEVDVSSIDYLPSRAFYGSRAVGGAFAYTAVQTLSFNSLNSNSFGNATDQFRNMLKGVTGCTVHFPSNLQSVIGSWTDVTSGFGGTNTTVLFDLPATT